MIRLRQSGPDYIERLSRAFERTADWCYAHRWLVLIAGLVLLFGALNFASRVRFDNSFESYFDRDDPAYAAYLRYRDDFGSDEVSYIVYRAESAPYGPWNIQVMRKIATLTEALASEVPFVKEVTSLTNVEWVEPVDDGIAVYDLLEEFPETQAELLAIRDKVLAKPMYVGGFASADGDRAAIMIEMEKSSVDPLDEIMLDPAGGNALENLYPQATYTRIESILARPEYRGIEFFHTGDVPLNSVINTIAARESGLLALGCAAVVALVLLAFFRRLSGFLGPMTVVALSIMVSMGLVGLLGWQLDLMFGMLPTLLIAVGVAASVHVISEFRAFHAQLASRREAVRRTMYLVGTPCLLTSLTTAAGFGAMATAPIKAVSHFGVYSAVGVLASFVLTTTFLMVFLSFGREEVSAERARRQLSGAKGGAFAVRTLERVGHFVVRRRRAILIAAAVVFAGSAAGISRLEVDSNWLDEFGDSVPIRDVTRYVDENMAGTNTFVYLFDTGRPEGIKNPELLRSIERLQSAADEQDYIVKKTYSIVDVLKDINQSMHEGDPAYYVLPETREMIGQYLLLYEMSGGDEISDYVSHDFSRANLELGCKWAKSSLIERMAGELGAHLERHPPPGAEVSKTGIGALWLQLIAYITESQIRSFLLAFVAITLMMCLLFQSVKTGLLAMIPNLLPVFLTLGVMGWIELPLDYYRLLIAPVAIGISVDDTIHHVTRFRHEFRKCGNYHQALIAAMRDVGRALFITSVVLVCGFLVFCASVMDSQMIFGILLAGTIVTALLADFLLMPPLMIAFRPFGPENQKAGVGTGDRPREAA